jgi:hypothetical protein
MHIVSLFTATVEINGASYAGGPANSKEEAASKAGCESFQLTPTIVSSLSIENTLFPFSLVILM